MLRPTRPQFVRLVAIDADLRRARQEHEPLPTARLELHPRTIQRGLDLMRHDLKAPLQYDRRRHGWRYLDLAYRLPFFSMAEGELISLLAAALLKQFRASPLEPLLDRALKKVVELLPERLALDFAAIGATLAALPAAARRTAAGPDAERVHLLPAPGLSGMGAGRMGRQPGHGGRRVRPPAGGPAGPPPGGVARSRRWQEREADAELHTRSLRLESAELGLVAIVDIVELEGSTATPVDYKKGKAPDLPEGAWEPERVQLCAQGLLLRSAGYDCREGVLWFAGSRRRVVIPFTEELIARTRSLIAEFRQVAAAGQMPPPLPRQCP